MEQFPILIAAAFLLGFGIRFVSLPPLVGFLLAGFALNAVGFSSTPELELVADLGVTLLLFTIGLKLRISSLLRPEIWAGASLHMAITVVILGGLFFLFSFGIFGGLAPQTAVLIAFALSFSSTVFAVKVFEEQGLESALHARTAIGILIIQDVVAVIFLAASTGSAPSPWALALILLIPARGLLKKIMERCGHGELLMLLGILLTVGGSALFDVVKLKGDLGALILGMLIADHPKAKEMARSLLSFKDLFLVGFFLSIGLRGIPTLPDLGIALVLIAVLPIKVALYFGLLTRFKLRARTATMTSLGLANYSEFGLIVASLGVSLGWLSEQWLLIIAVAVAGTFIAASPINAGAHRIYDRIREWAMRFETKGRIPEEEPVDAGEAEAVVFGMGRVGAAAYDAMHVELGDRVIGVDHDPAVVQQQVEAGRRVLQGEPTDVDFWDRCVRREGQVKIVMLALHSVRANLVAATELRKLDPGHAVLVTATAEHDDDVRELEERGVDCAFNLYAEAGQGYADFVRAAFERRVGS